MKSLKSLSVIVIVTILISSCAKIFYSPDASMLAHSQKNIAILPSTVSIEAKKKIDFESMSEEQKTESLNFQKEIYSWMLKRKMQGKITQEIQEIETTNAKLKKAGYPENPLTTSELCEVLGVNGIIISNFKLSKPISDEIAIAGRLLSSALYLPNNEVHASFSISDCNNKKLIWNYDNKISGSIGNNRSNLVDRLIMQAISKMPYMNK